MRLERSGKASSVGRGSTATGAVAGRLRMLSRPQPGRDGASPGAVLVRAPLGILVRRHQVVAAGSSSRTHAPAPYPAEGDREAQCLAAACDDVGTGSGQDASP